MNRWTDEVWKHGPGEAMMRFVLVRLADRADREGCCWPSIPSIAADCGLGISTVKRALARLSSEGWIEYKPGNGKGRHSQFRMLFKKGSQRAPLNPEPDKQKGSQRAPLNPEPDKQKGSQRAPLNPEPDKQKGSQRAAKGFTESRKGVQSGNPPHTPPSSEPPKNPQGNLISLRDKPAIEKGSSRHVVFREHYLAWFTRVNGAAPQWTGREGKALNDFLDAHPALTCEEWQRILNNRAAGNCNSAKEFSSWIKHALAWLNGPADDFGNIPREGYVDRHVRAERSVAVHRARHERERDDGQASLADVLFARALARGEIAPVIEGRLTNGRTTDPLSAGHNALKHG
jgi:hypothetical protein